MPKTVITFIGAGSTVFTKNIAGDILSRPSLAAAEIRLMDINPERQAESETIVGKLSQTLGGKASVKTFTDQKRALTGADFVVVCFQIGGYEPSTVVDFEIPKKYNLRQTIGSIVGILTKAPVREELSETAPARLASPVAVTSGEDLVGEPEAAHAE